MYGLPASHTLNTQTLNLLGIGTKKSPAEAGLERSNQIHHLETSILIDFVKWRPDSTPVI